MSSFKNTGFPMPTFNPIGFRSSGSLYKDLIKNCGLDAYNTPETDKVGKQSRPAIQAETVLGDGVTYLEVNSTPNISSAKFEFKIKFNSLLDFKRIRATNGVNFVSLVTYNDRLYFSDNNNISDIHSNTVLSVGVEYDIVVEYDGVLENTKFYVDGVQTTTTESGTGIVNSSENTILSKENGNNSINSNLIEYKETINGTTYTLAINNGNYQLVPSNQSIDPIQVTQFIAPPIPTEINTTEVSMFDVDGYSVARALGNQMYNKLVLGMTGTYLDSIGNQIVSSGWFTSPYMYAKAETDVYFDTLTSSPLVYVCLFELDGTFISSISNIDVISNSLKITTPNRPILIRCSSNTFNTTVDDFMVQYDSFPTIYEPFEGYTKDQAGTEYYPDGTIIPNFTGTSTSIAWVDGVHPQGEYSGRVKFDKVVCDVSGVPTGGLWESGAYIIDADKYNEKIISDTQEICYVNGEPVPQAYDDMALETPTPNPQQMVSVDKQKILWFKEPLPDGSECYQKALKFLGFNKIALDSNGLLAIDTNDDIAEEV